MLGVKVAQGELCTHVPVDRLRDYARAGECHAHYGIARVVNLSREAYSRKLIRALILHRTPNLLSA